MPPFIYNDDTRLLHVAALARVDAILCNVCRNWWQEGFLNPGVLELGKSIAITKEESASVDVLFVFEEDGWIDKEEGICIQTDDLAEG